MAGDVWEPMGYESEEDDRDREEEPDQGGGIPPLIDRDNFFDLLMEQQKQM